MMSFPNDREVWDLIGRSTRQPDLGTGSQTERGKTLSQRGVVESRECEGKAAKAYGLFWTHLSNQAQMSQQRKGVYIKLLILHLDTTSSSH